MRTAVPRLEEFVGNADKHPVVSVMCELVADTLTPVSCFSNLVGEGEGFLLESVEGGERWGRYSFVGRRPLATITARGQRVTVEGALESAAPTDRGILAYLEVLLAELEVPADPALPPLHSGIVGYLGYDVVREIERLPTPPPDDRGYPDASLFVLGEVCVFDHWRQRILLVVNVAIERGATRSAVEARYDEAIAALDALARDCFAPTAHVVLASPDRHQHDETFQLKRSMTSDEYCNAVGVAKEFIAAGDIFQVVLAQRFDCELGTDPFAVYRALRLLNPSPYLYFLRFSEVTVAGSSPEAMVRLRDGEVTIRPIAGSRPRGTTDFEDDRLAGELSEDPKEIAEHVMLVDLARNDVGRVSTYGSEVVDEMMTIERYSHIMHLTSQVHGTLAEGRGPIDVLRASMPAGTLSGAPKVRAMEIIDELEVTRRGIYGGVVGYFDFSGNLDTAISIRTLVVGSDGRASIQAGAGIVADSDPRSEDAECSHKVAAVKAAIIAARQMTSDASQLFESNES